MTIQMNNIYNLIPGKSNNEIIQILAQNKHVRIERIISMGHASEKDFWYDQEQDEFVLLLKGKAGIKFSDNAREITLSPGDYLIIKAHQKHRVAWTHAEEETIWITVFF